MFQEIAPVSDVGRHSLPRNSVFGEPLIRAFALRRPIMARNFAAQPGRSSWAERSSASAPAATSLVMTLPDPM